MVPTLSLLLQWKRVKLAEAKFHTTTKSHPLSNEWLALNVNGNTPEQIANKRKKGNEISAKRREVPDMRMQHIAYYSSAYNKTDAGK
jgi:hypothetical protein